MSEHVPQVHGHCDPRFAAVRAAFEENFRERGELGAAVSVTVDGVPVADLWGGWADPARTRAWERDTLVNVWSTSKGPTALCAHILADRGCSTSTRRSPCTGRSSGRRARGGCSCGICCPTVRGSPDCASRTLSSSSTTES